jgi:anti-sigma factor RsiW
MSAREQVKRCEDVAPLLVFYACDEVTPQEREKIEAHLSVCPACAKQLEQELAMQTVVCGASQPADQLDPAGALLAQCRSELSELLDDLSAPPVREHWMPFGWIRRWMALRPAWSAALLVLLGLAVGTQVYPWLSARDGGSNSGNGIGQAMNVKAVPTLTDDDLSKMAVAGISFAPSSDAAPGTFQVQVRTEQPLVVSGNLDDADVRHVLTYVVANGERFDPGMRLDCLDFLKARTGDLEVRRALLAAAGRDPNPAVRIKALEALRDFASDDSVRATLLEALRHDANPGVRVEAVNLLVRSLEGEPLAVPGVPGVPPVPELATLSAEPAASVERVVRALEDLQRRDPNRYVRLRSAAALRQIGPHDLQ